MVDGDRWEYIQKKFPERVEKWMNGEDAVGDDETMNVTRVIAEDGELHSEYDGECERVAREREAEERRDRELTSTQILSETENRI